MVSGSTGTETGCESAVFEGLPASFNSAESEAVEFAVRLLESSPLAPIPVGKAAGFWRFGLGRFGLVCSGAFVGNTANWLGGSDEPSVSGFGPAKDGMAGRVVEASRLGPCELAIGAEGN